jgi:hemolysin-activating ACP:hemolysin acyltransferase
MPAGFRRVYQAELYDDSSEARVLGEIVTVLGCNPRNSLRPIGQVRTVLGQAIAHKQLRVLYNEEHDPVAYVAWAFLPKDVEHEILRSGRIALQLEDWARGSQLWILDLACAPGHLGEVLRYLRDMLFADVASARYARRKGRVFRVRQVHRHRLLGLLRHAPALVNRCRCDSTECPLWNAPIHQMPCWVPSRTWAASAAVPERSELDAALTAD